MANTIATKLTFAQMVSKFRKVIDECNEDVARLTDFYTSEHPGEDIPPITSYFAKSAIGDFYGILISSVNDMVANYVNMGYIPWHIKSALVMAGYYLPVELLERLEDIEWMEYQDMLYSSDRDEED